MKNLRKLGAAIVLTCVLALAAVAGETHALPGHDEAAQRAGLESALEGEPARASRSAMLTSRREND